MERLQTTNILPVVDRCLYDYLLEKQSSVQTGLISLSGDKTNCAEKKQLIHGDWILVSLSIGKYSKMKS